MSFLRSLFYFPISFILKSKERNFIETILSGVLWILLIEFFFQVLILIIKLIELIER